MTSLTALPAEILRHILVDVLLAKRDPPTCPSETQDRTRLSGSRGVWIKTTGLEIPAVPLLLVNHLINQHVQAIIAAPKPFRHYVLDIMFVKMAGLWPTWTSVPALTRHVDTLHATFRIFNPAPDLDPKFGKSGLLGRGNGGMQRGVWNFYHLLTAFLEGGPQALSASGPVHTGCRYTVRHLVIDVSAPPADEDHTVTGPGVVSNAGGRREMGETFSLVTPEGWHGPASLEPRIQPAEKLALFLHHWIRLLLDLSYGPDNTMVLYEGILDNIEFRVDGETRCRIGTEDALAVAAPRGGHAERERFRQWKDWVGEKRRLGRLRCHPPGERPHKSIRYFW